MSQPILVIVNPFASIILSMWLFNERFTNSPAKITTAVLSFAAMAAGVTMLTRTAPQDLTRRNQHWLQRQINRIKITRLLAVAPDRCPMRAP